MDNDSFFGDDAVRLDLLRHRAFNLRWAELPLDVIPLTAADPDFPAAPVIRQAVADYTSSGVFSYGPAGGLPLFRESVSRYLDSRQCSVPPAGVIAVNSAAAGLAMVAQHWLAPGDEAIVFDPVDFLFAHVVRAAGAIPVSWRVTREGALDLVGLERLITPRTRMVCVCNPHNPLGRCFTRAELEVLGEFCTARGLRILSDEIWSEIVYAPAKFTSMLALSPAVAANTVVVHGFSKAFALAGLRIGYVAMCSADACAEMLAASQHPSTVDGAATLSQVAAAAAYDHALPWLDGFLRHLQARRDQVVMALRAVPGLEVIVPDATYVVFVRLPPAVGDVEACVQRLREEFRVAVVPGSSRWFGDAAVGHFRLCFATSEALLTQGLERLVTGLLVMGASSAGVNP